MFERLLHTVARKVQKKENVDELKVRQWQEDDKNVREGNCSFQVQVSTVYHLTIAYVSRRAADCVFHKRFLNR